MPAEAQQPCSDLLVSRMSSCVDCSPKGGPWNLAGDLVTGPLWGHLSESLVLSTSLLSN